MCVGVCVCVCLCVCVCVCVCFLMLVRHSQKYRDCVRLSIDFFQLELPNAVKTFLRFKVSSLVTRTVPFFIIVKLISLSQGPRDKMCCFLVHQS